MPRVIGLDLAPRHAAAVLLREGVVTDFVAVQGRQVLGAIAGALATWCATLPDPYVFAEYYPDAHPAVRLQYATIRKALDPPPYTVPPAVWKKALTGQGDATKEAVQEYVLKHVDLSGLNEPDPPLDAAVAAGEPQEPLDVAALPYDFFDAVGIALYGHAAVSHELPAPPRAEPLAPDYSRLPTKRGAAGRPSGWRISCCPPDLWETDVWVPWLLLAPDDAISRGLRYYSVMRHASNPELPTPNKKEAWQAARMGQPAMAEADAWCRKQSLIDGPDDAPVVHNVDLERVLMYLLPNEDRRLARIALAVHDLLPKPRSRYLYHDLKSHRKIDPTVIKMLQRADVLSVEHHVVTRNCSDGFVEISMERDPSEGKELPREAEHLVRGPQWADLEVRLAEQREALVGEPYKSSSYSGVTIIRPPRKKVDPDLLREAIDEYMAAAGPDVSYQEAKEAILNDPDRRAAVEVP